MDRLYREINIRQGQIEDLDLILGQVTDQVDEYQ